MEFDGAEPGAIRASRMMHVNKVRHVKTITRIAVEDGVIRVDGVGEDGVQAFTSFGFENLIELVRIYKENPTWLKRRQPG